MGEGLIVAGGRTGLRRGGVSARAVVGRGFRVRQFVCVGGGGFFSD